MNFNLDMPIENEKEDKLNRNKFAKNLADAILKQENERGLTIGLIGKWGSGKSSIINLTKANLKNEELIIVDFNPWYFSTQNNLYQQFFNVISSEIEKREFGDKFWIEKKIFQIKTQWKKLPKITRENKNNFEFIKEKIYSLRELRSSNILNNYYNQIKSNSSINFNIPGVGYSYNFDESKKEYNSISYLKNKCDEYFLNLDYKFLVVIDDIDRMTPAEIEQIFILVKSLANFPKFTYLLSFDKEVVVNSLKDVPEDFRNSFIEKIIQIPIIIPEISDANLNTYIEEEIKSLYDTYLKSNFRGEDEFQKVSRVIKYFIKNIRDLKRYINAIIFYSSFMDELNINDMFILIALHTFEYNIYLKIKDDFSVIAKDEWIYFKDETYIKETISQLLSETKLLLEHINEDHLNSTISTLFPLFDVENLNLNRISGEFGKWDFECRICSHHHFDKYFTLTLENYEISSVLLTEFFELQSVDEIYNVFLAEKENGSFKSLIENFRYFLDKIPNENIKYYIYALMKYGDEILEDEKFNTFESIYWELIRKIESKKEVYTILNNCICDGNIYVMTSIIYSLSYYYGHWGDYSDEIPEEYNILIEYDLFKLEEMILEKLKELLINKTLLSHEKLSSIIYYWYLLSGEKMINNLKTYIQTDKEKMIITQAIEQHRELKKINQINLFKGNTIS